MRSAEACAAADFYFFRNFVSITDSASSETAHPNSGRRGPW